MSTKSLPPLGAGLIPLMLSACGSGGLLTTVGPDYQAKPLPAPTSWQAPQADSGNLFQAHRGDPTELMRWWDGFRDPVLSRLLNAAEQVSTSVADAAARIVEARANRVGADAALLPNLHSELASKRSSSSFGGSPFIWNQFSAGLQSSWEIDLFGGLSRQMEATQSQLASRNASWHDARVAVAVEVAEAYLAHRYCQAQEQLFRADSDSRQESARLTAIAGINGFRSPSDVALANASAAEGSKNLLQQHAQCERSLKSLVAMTGLAETELRQLLKDAEGLPRPPAFGIASLPAKVLLQRPDLAAAERDLAEASANIGVQRAKQFPKLSLSGNITPTLQNINGAALMLAQTWAIGPTLSLPLFDAGKRAADVEVAKAQYQAAESRFRAKVRTAVKEVEDALVRLDSTRQRLPQGQVAVSGYRENFQALQRLYQSGLGNLLDLETARRNMLAADLALKDLEREQVGAWISLYRAAGGGWSDDAHSPNANAAGINPQKPANNDNPDLFSQHHNTFNGGES
ncbi:efflux transporter outer membrane subunit [Methylomonas sp. SURF-2]|uniref:Efflux transporter outer membrane subunit n=1 Tax=Methylomonas subterranea TaxID=2952225 RepID=A0ABT1TD55_9GAMM|nr:efflux transporter outer membrane subunit [Methylomonas sp. SURF-2]MCQ8103391.1 efflux transporter outer membrane subunit [Methylomonas sp. SURF-2]